MTHPSPPDVPPERNEKERYRSISCFLFHKSMLRYAIVAFLPIKKIGRLGDRSIFSPETNGESISDEVAGWTGGQGRSRNPRRLWHRDCSQKPIAISRVSRRIIFGIGSGCNFGERKKRKRRGRETQGRIVSPRATPAFYL